MDEQTKREPERADLYAAKDVAALSCVCPVHVQATRSELTFKQFRRVACKPCQAKACLEWLMEIGDQ